MTDAMACPAAGNRCCNGSAPVGLASENCLGRRTRRIFLDRVAEGKRSRQHLIQEHTQREDIRPLIHRLDIGPPLSEDRSQLLRGGIR